MKTNLNEIIEYLKDYVDDITYISNINNGDRIVFEIRGVTMDILLAGDTILTEFKNMVNKKYKDKLLNDVKISFELYKQAENKLEIYNKLLH